MSDKNWFQRAANSFHSAVSDLFRERKGGKVSSKKVWGHIFLALAGTMAVLDGLHFYDINENVFNTLVAAGCTLIGLKIIKEIFNKPTATADAVEK